MSQGNHGRQGWIRVACREKPSDGFRASPDTPSELCLGEPERGTAFVDRTYDPIDVIDATTGIPVRGCVQGILLSLAEVPLGARFPSHLPSSSTA
jgi:hypothetical protein